MTNPYVMQTITLASTVTVPLLTGLQNPVCLRTSHPNATMFLGVIVYQLLSAETLPLSIHHMFSSRGLYHTHLLSFFNRKLRGSMVLIQLRTSGPWVFCFMHF
jgi:hypothetical protein